MPYLICNICDHYYEIESKEEFKHFNMCECGNPLIYVDNLEDYEPRESIAIGTSYTEKMANSQNINTGSTSTNEESKNKNLTYYILGVTSILMGVFLLNIIFIIALLLLVVGLASIIMGLLRSTSPAKKINTPTTKTPAKSSWEKGLVGEKIVLNHLNTLPADYFVFHDVKLPQSRGNIDHVVLGPNGIFVIETKNYSGFYRVYNNDWEYQKGGQFYKTKTKPGKQVFSNTLDIKYFLESEGIPTSDIPLKAIVAFVSKRFKIMEKPDNYVVLFPETVPDYIQNQNRKFDENLLKKAALALEPHCIELTFKRKD